MQNGSQDSQSAEANSTGCAFCRRNDIAYVLKETSNFLVAADHAPLVEGHLLIIPKRHYACYGSVPSELDAELFALKREVGQFLSHFYAPAVFWEHGVFRQTVFHAHLHCFPFGNAQYDSFEGLYSVVVHSQDDIRAWYATEGDYFYMEDARAALLFMPEVERYLQVIKNVFQRGIQSRGGHGGWRPPQQRYEEGVPLIAAMAEKWRTFQKQGVHYANESSA
jgi:diadenosine tetraphosphate (Ap4A) HIT family hydrolase